jgi:hypothetical protein
MTRATIAGAAIAIVFLLLVAGGVGYLVFGTRSGRSSSSAAGPEERPVAVPPAAAATGTTATHSPAGRPGELLYGRVTGVDGTVWEGRLRWGVDQEASWGDTFNGVKRENPWVAHVPADQLPRESRAIEFLGITITNRETQLDAIRQLMVRFGEITRVESQGRDVTVTLKSGTSYVLDRLEASDFDDGLRVWDGERGDVDLTPRQIRTIELSAPPPQAAGDRAPGAAPSRLHGTVHTQGGAFTGAIGWNRQLSLGSDEISLDTGDAELRLRFDAIASIARASADATVVTTVDGRELSVAGKDEDAMGALGVYVDDRRYGRVLVRWAAFERLDFSAAGAGPGYDDFPAGRPLRGAVQTRDGRRLAGRLVYDLDESETTETVDAESGGVQYNVLFGLIASIAPLGPDAEGMHRAKVTLHSGEELQLAGSSDVGEKTTGMLVFADGEERAKFVSWADVERIDLEPPPAMYPPVGTP